MNKKLRRIMYISNVRLDCMTNILLSMLLSLVEMGFYVRTVNVLEHHNITSNPDKHVGGYGPVEIRYEHLQNEINTFKPQVIIFAAGGYTFSEQASKLLKQKGIILLGITLSDPDVFRTAKNYAKRFSYHTTNSKAALDKYKQLGFKNTLYLPFGIDSRFFTPTRTVPEYRCDVVIIGHYQPSRRRLSEELMKRFDTKIYGLGWPFDNVTSVAYPEWLKVVHSGKIVVDFPRTQAGFYNIKIRMFEVAATGTLLITEYLDEIGEFFEYDKEIIGYKDENEMYKKIQYYLDNPKKRIQIAKNAQQKCAEKHMWKNRFEGLFNKIGFEL